MTAEITEEQALAVAEANARTAYRDLSVYEVVATRVDDATWHVDYELRDPGSVGGGPHYVISATTGEITGMRFEQ